MQKSAVAVPKKLDPITPPVTSRKPEQRPRTDSPSTRTRGAKRKEEEPVEKRSHHRRRKLQLTEDPEETEETEETEDSEENSGETIRSESEETATTNPGDETDNVTHVYNQGQTLDTPEEVKRNFGG
ncbi:hypothetical protein R1sor_019521 [Riccia sorocarpa]|uniref:Uncharacterized protein n=1 Tax=Riccia sorocarpa TaxID=122646 RepID=A0ABD3IEH5_9MARC